MNANKIRMPVDITMTLLSIILMGGASLFPSDIIHEILGMALFLLWAVHITLNRRWYSSIFRGKYNARQYSVRQVEEMVQALKSGDDVKTAKGKIQSQAKLPEEFNILRDRLSQFFQAKVQMTCSPQGKGKITIQFDNEEQLEHIMNTLDGANG